ncbi:MAG: (2Fe-2S)-binding protein [Peptostreptococcaceae bacterium]
MSKDNLVCLCKKISEDTIINAIKNGATTVEEVKEVTGATSGMCRGIRCKKKIKTLIDQYK